MKQTLIKYSIVFVIGVITGILLFNHFRPRPKPCVTVAAQPGKLLAQLAETEAQYNARLDSMNLANSILQRKVLKTQSTLAQVKQQNRELHQTVEDLISVHDTTDTTAKLENCDSLATVVQELMVSDSTKDALYETITDGYRQELAIRDSIISFQAVQYDSVLVAYIHTLQEQQALVQENQAQRKQLKQHKRGKGLLSAILVAVGSLFVYQAIQ